MTTELLHKACQRCNLLSPEDMTILNSISLLLIPEGATEGERALANEYAYTTLLNIRRALREPYAVAAAENIEVKKAVIGTRYYWRVLDTNQNLHTLGSEDSRNKGTLARARQKAVELLINGIQPIALVPPDLDEVALRREEQQQNHSGFQPAGLTVRQREKKH